MKLEQVEVNKEQLKLAEEALRRAGAELKTAWTLLKHNGMEPTAKELADTVLDVEISADQLREFLTPNVQGNRPAALFAAGPG